MASLKARVGDAVLLALNRAAHDYPAPSSPSSPSDNPQPFHPQPLYALFPLQATHARATVDIAVHNQVAAHVMHVACRAAEDALPGAQLALHAPFSTSFGIPCALVAELRHPQCGDILRAYMIPYPVPLGVTHTPVAATRANAGRDPESTVYHTSTRFAAAHAVYAAMWRHACGDARGASAHREVAARLFATLSEAPTPVPSLYYAGAIPTESVVARHSRRRAMGTACGVRWITPENGAPGATPKAVRDITHAALRVRGGHPSLLDGRQVGAHACSDLLHARQHTPKLVAAAMAAAVKECGTHENVVADQLGLVLVLPQQK